MRMDILSIFLVLIIRRIVMRLSPHSTTPMQMPEYLEFAFNFNCTRI